jgi:hypothetical protein
MVPTLVGWIFIEAAFHWSSFSSKRLFIEATFHWSGFSSKLLFIEVAFYGSGFSSKRLFIKPCQKWLIHQMDEWLHSMKWLFIELCQKWLIHRMDEWLHSMKWQRLFIFCSFHWKHSKTCPWFLWLNYSIFYVELCFIIDSFIQWMSHFYLGSMKSHHYRHSMKRRFNEKVLRWKAAWMKSRPTAYLTSPKE